MRKSLFRSDYSELKTWFMKISDHFLGLPLCLILGIWHRISHPFFHHMSRTPIKDPKTILIIKFFGLGSLLLQTPLVRSIKNKYPAAKIIFLTFKENADLLSRLSLCDEIRVVDPSNPFSFFYSTLINLFHLSLHKPQISVDLEFFSKYCTLISYLSGAKCRISFHLPQFWKSSLITVPVFFNYSRNILDIYNMVAAAIDARYDDYSLPKLSTTPKENCTIEHLFEQFHIQNNNFVLAINVNASDLALCRRWPRNNFIEVIDSLLRKHPHLYILLTGNKKEKLYTHAVWYALRKDISSRCFDLSGTLSFGEFIALLKKIDAFFTNDSGPFHLASSEEVSIVSLWGPTSPLVHGPHLNNKNKHSILYTYWPCSPCAYIYRTNAGYFCKGVAPCLKTIDPVEAIGVLDKIIKKANIIRDSNKQGQHLD